jgi:hypothetical protein
MGVAVLYLKSVGGPSFAENRRRTTAKSMSISHIASRAGFPEEYVRLNGRLEALRV